MTENKKKGKPFTNSGNILVKTPEGRVLNFKDYMQSLEDTKRESQKKYQIGDIIKLRISGNIIKITEIGYKNAETGEYDYAGCLADGTFPERLYLINQEDIECIIKEPVNIEKSKNNKFGGHSERY